MYNILKYKIIFREVKNNYINSINQVMEGKEERWEEL